MPRDEGWVRGCCEGINVVRIRDEVVSDRLRHFQCQNRKGGGAIVGKEMLEKR
jgi:hypothetical protein